MEFISIVSLLAGFLEVMSGPVPSFTVVTREAWGAKPPTRVTLLRQPVPYVVIHHTVTPECKNTESCARNMRSMQEYHMVEQQWSDIGYNFCVGGDGKVYVGGGWTHKGTHARNFNSVSIGISLIGDFREVLPTPQQLSATRLLIEQGVTNGNVTSDHAIIGHKQVTSTLCPGDALFSEISTWSHFSPVAQNKTL